MSRSPLRAVPIALCVAGLFWAGSSSRAARQARDTDAPGTVYRLSFPEPQHRWMQVEATFVRPSAPLELVMSRASPGRYALHEFAKNVFDLGAADGAGRALPVARTATHRWTVSAHDGRVAVRYRVYGDRVDGTYLAVDPTHAHINIPAALVWARGLEGSPATVTLVPPSGSNWRVATQLFPTSDPFTFTAPNLAYLVDSPIEASRHVWRSAKAPLPGGTDQGSAPVLELALHHAGPEQDADAFMESLQRIAAEQAAIFGEYPRFEQDRYTFLADYLPWAAGDGMEHRNSTVLTSSARLPDSRLSLLGTAAHELFHAWNVERIRPRSLEPFDLESPNMSAELWLAEGVTNYYEDLTLHRSGVASLADTLRSFSAMIASVAGSPALQFRSAEDMSRMAPLVDGARPVDRTNWNYSFVSYYVHGAALGLGLDLAIRERTASRRSLDDFMRLMWERHGRPGGSPVGTVAAPYTIDDVRARLAEVTGDDAFAGGLIARYVQGRETMDYERLLGLAGLRLQPASPGRASLGPVALERVAAGFRLAAPSAPGSPLYEAGITEDDELLALEGRTLAGAEGLDPALGRFKPGDRVELRVRRRGEQAPIEVTVTLAEDTRAAIVSAESAGGSLTASQRGFRDAWLRSRAR